MRVQPAADVFNESLSNPAMPALFADDHIVDKSCGFAKLFPGSGFERCVDVADHHSLLLGYENDGLFLVNLRPQEPFVSFLWILARRHESQRIKSEMCTQQGGAKAPQYWKIGFLCSSDNCVVHETYISFCRSLSFHFAPLAQSIKLLAIW